jgi:hypothetical protein
VKRCWTDELFSRVRVFAIFLWLGFGALRPSSAQGLQSWNEIDLTGAWKNLHLLVPLHARVYSGTPNPQLAATGAIADISVQRHFTLTGGYLFAVLPQRSLDAHLPLVAITPSFRLGRLVFADRNRFEKLIDFPTDPVRYRNRFLVDGAFGPQQRWHVYATDEVFFNLTAGNWNQNRLQFGCGTALRPTLSLDLYYLQQNPNGAPTAHVIGTTLTILWKSRKEKERASP